MIAILNGKPEFSNASHRAARDCESGAWRSKWRANVSEVDSILGEAPSPDREAMRIKQYIDFGFIACYASLYLALACVVSAQGWGSRRRSAGRRAASAGLDGKCRDPADSRCPAARYHAGDDRCDTASESRQVGAGVSRDRVVRVYVSEEPAGILSRAAGCANLAAAALGIYGLYDNAFLVWAGVPMLAGLAGIIAIAFVPDGRGMKTKKVG